MVLPLPLLLCVCRYVTPGAFVEAAEEFGIPREVAVRNWDGCIQARAALYLPGGRIAKELSRNPTVLVVNDTAFAHGGLLPTHGACTVLGGHGDTGRGVFESWLGCQGGTTWVGRCWVLGCLVSRKAV